MFSWSQPGSRKPSSNQYPGRRTTTRPSSSNGVHAPVEGSIRPPSNASNFTRAQHIQSYLEDSTLQRSTRRVSSDDTTYDTVFQTTKGDTLIVRVNVPLASSFASFCPAMTLAGVKAKHPWIDKNLRLTGFDAIRSEKAWRESGLSLGQAVHAVVKHLQLHPPEILEITDPGLLAIQPPNSKFRSGGSGPKSASTARGRPSKSPSRTSNHNRNTRRGPASNGGAPPSYETTVQNQSIPPAPRLSLPSIPHDFNSLLEDKSREEMEALLSDQLDFLSMVHQMDIFVKIQSEGKAKGGTNVQTAQKNLAQQAKIEGLRAEMDRLQTTLEKKVQRFQSLEKEQDALCAPPDVKSTLRELNKAKKQSFEESEEFAEEWVEDGALNTDQFLKEFIERRKVHHSRASKMELLENHGNTTQAVI